MVVDPGPSPAQASGLAAAADALRGSERRRRLRRGLLASILSIGALVVVCEVGLRASQYRERFFEKSVNKTNRRWVELTTAGLFEEIADPVRRYAMRPFAEVRIDDWTFRVSSHRSRGPDFPLAKERSERRILCLGDSFAFGLWCGEDETLVAHLARFANERERERGSGLSWRAVNLGMPGYHAGQSLRALEQDGLALAPDVVVYYFNTNDIEQQGFFFDERLGVLRRDFLPLPVRLRRLLWNSHLYGWIATQVRNAIEARPAPQFDPEVPYAFVREDNQRATLRSIARMAELLAERRIPFFLVHQPLLTWQGDLRRPDWIGARLVDWAENMRAELGLAGVSLLGLFRGWSDGVDRTEEGSSSYDFLLDSFCADERMQAAVDFARARAAEAGLGWDELPYDEKIAFFAGLPGEMPPSEPDFHLIGAGYGAIARVVYPRMQQAGLLP